MAVDFEALDLVRSQNKSRSYNKKLNELVKENRELGICTMRLHVLLNQEISQGRSTTLKERFEKIKKTIIPSCLMYKTNKGEL